MADQEHIDAGLLSTNFDMIQALPLNVKQRVCALKNLQMKTIQIESDFYKRVHELEIEFEGKFKSTFDQRKAIVAGEVEPTKEQIDTPILEGLEGDQLAELYKLRRLTHQQRGSRISGSPLSEPMILLLKPSRSMTYQSSHISLM